MVDGISEEIQQLIADYANAARINHEISLHPEKTSWDDRAETGLAERQALAALHVAIADLSENAECQTLERESAERELARQL